jgi:DNA repair exonuclease SbcCD ATPase subunit
MNDEIEFLDSHTAALSPLQRALALDAQADAKAEHLERREEAERQATAQERTELLQLAYRGIPAGELQRMRAAAVEADDEVRDLSDRLAKAEARRARVHENITALTARLSEISEAVASRSSAPDMLAPAREALQAHREYVQASRAAMAAVRAPRPFVSGAVVRGEMCPECAAVGASEAESFLIHQDPAPEAVPADFDGSELAAYPWQGEDAEHRRAGRAGREITRLTSADGMGQPSTLTGMVVR